MCLKTKKKLFQRFSVTLCDSHTHGEKWQIKRERKKGKQSKTIIVCEQGKKNANKDDALRNGRDENSDTLRFAEARHKPPLQFICSENRKRARGNGTPRQTSVWVLSLWRCGWSGG